MRLLLLLALAAPSFCCLNDREVERSDAEFRAAYGEGVADTVDVVKGTALGGFIALGVGGAALLAVGLYRRRQAKQAADRQ